MSARGTVACFDAAARGLIPCFAIEHPIGRQSVEVWPLTLIDGVSATSGYLLRRVAQP